MALRLRESNFPYLPPVNASGDMQQALGRIPLDVALGTSSAQHILHVYGQSSEFEALYRVWDDNLAEFDGRRSLAGQVNRMIKLGVLRDLGVALLAKQGANIMSREDLVSVLETRYQQSDTARKVDQSVVEAAVMDEEHPEQIRYLLIPYDRAESAESLRGFVEANLILLGSLRYRVRDLFHPQAQVMVVVGDGNSQSDKAKLLKIPGVRMGDITKLVDDLTGAHSTRTHRGQGKSKPSHSNAGGGRSASIQDRHVATSSSASGTSEGLPLDDETAELLRFLQTNGRGHDSHRKGNDRRR